MHPCHFSKPVAAHLRLAKAHSCHTPLTLQIRRIMLLLFHSYWRAGCQEGPCLQLGEASPPGVVLWPEALVPRPPGVHRQPGSRSERGRQHEDRAGERRARGRTAPADGGAACGGAVQ